ncbi:MAG: hypothetical protein GY702_28735 [Desulfobulbaceae bacterium]|nr:hypothetical protein [Desulfobulbaceae bacterium]
MDTYYSLFHLNVQSQVKLPAPAVSPLVVHSSGPSVSVVLDPDLQIPSSLQEDSCFDVNRKKGYFFYKDVGSFCIQDGRHISVKPAPGVDESFLSVSTVGTPMGILFFQRGYFVMHGSSVNIQGKAYVFLGESRAGKSTAALAMVTSGFPLLTDDVVVIEQSLAARNGQLPRVIPSFAWMKVDKEIVAYGGVAPSRLETVAKNSSKQLFELSTDEFCSESLPLGGIFILDWGPDFAVEDISAREAMVCISPYSYGPAPRTKYPDDTAIYFQNAAALIEAVPCYKLIRPHDLNRLLELPKRVAEYIKNL